MITVKHGVFHLQNEKSSYLFRVRDGFLEHLHLGTRLSASDADALAVRPGNGWGDSTLYREGSNANCLDIFPLEWSSCGRGDYRESPMELLQNGVPISTEFHYIGCEALKSAHPSALPASRGQTVLAVYLEDSAAKLRLTLLYGVLPTVFTRRAILENCGDTPISIRKLMSANTDLPGDWTLHIFSGGWIAEMQHTETPVTMARTCLESTTGASSSRANPGFLLAAPDAAETAGEVCGFNLLYSGSHYLSAQKSLQEYHSAPSDEKLNYRQDVENIFVTIMSIYDNIRSIYVFDNYGNEFYLRNRSGIGLELLEQESWYQDALARQGAYVIFLDRHGGEENTTIGIARSIVNIYDRQSYGVALVEIPYSILAETIYGGNGKSNLQQGAIFIGDEQGNRIYATQSDDPYRDMGADEIPPAGTAQTRVFTADGEEIIRITCVSAKTGWRYDYVCEMKYLMRDMAQLQSIMTVLVLCVLLAAVCFLIVFSHRTFRPLGELVSAMQQVKEGRYAVKVETESNDEFRYLGQTFNDMASSIEELIQKVYSAQLMQKEAQLEVLQQQINPHFLYNTFETMRGIALSEHNEKVADIVKNISEFMRYNMYGADGSTSLQMELQHVTNYIRIMDYRFDDKIRLTMEIPEQMRALSMPKFTLQPIVENAVLHGFTEKRADCEICISGQVQDGAARLRIVDNGCGIAADALEKINADLKEPFQPGQPRNGRVSIGIYNVNSRLKLNYGDKYGVRIFSEVGVGTTAEIEFPAVMQKPGADSALRLRMKKAEQEDADS